MNDRCVLSQEEAAAKLPPGDEFQVFVRLCDVLVPSTWSRGDVLDEVAASVAEMPSEDAQKLGFVLVLRNGSYVWFVRPMTGQGDEGNERIGEKNMGWLLFGAGFMVGIIVTLLVVVWVLLGLGSEIDRLFGM